MFGNRLRGGGCGLLAGATALALILAGCGGGGGAGGNGDGKPGSEVLYPDAVSLVDGRVGDSPFTDDGGDSGLADGRSLASAGGTPVTIEWDPVSFTFDKSAETELAGYRIYLGHKPGIYQYVIEVGDPVARSFDVAGLPAGTYYFAVSAVDRLNREGPLSGVAAVTID